MKTQADPARDIQRVNEHLQHTHSKIELQQQKTIVENAKTAPQLDRAPTYDDPERHRSYGVDMQIEKTPVDTMDFDHLDQPYPQAN
ncbi:MAG TPA: hypothetical protein VFV50_04610 [Bdellovibrionales bacterium]|nr:hypothetical protein [Bdellovibrionales bacterium]